MNDSEEAMIVYGFTEKSFMDKSLSCKIGRHKFKDSGYKDEDGDEIHVCLRCYQKIAFEYDSY